MCVRCVCACACGTQARDNAVDNSREARRMAPATVARAVRRAYGHGKARLCPGAKNKLFQYIGYLAPRITGAAMKKAIFDKLPARDDLAMGHVAVDTAPVS